MPNKFVTFAFGAGVLSESLVGRTDIEKADLGLKKADNYYIDYRGGALSRQGTEFGDAIQGNPTQVRLVPFRFNSSLGNNYMMLVTAKKIRFIQDNAYVLEAAVGIDSLSNSTNLVSTDTAHGYSTGDLVKLQGTASSGLEGLVFEISVSGANEFTLLSPEGEAIDLSGYSGEGPASSATVSRVYTVTTTYTKQDLHSLTFSQFRDEVYITGENYPPKKLVRLGATNWTISNVDFANDSDRPANVTETVSSGSAGAVYAVTAVFSDGSESLDERIIVDNAVNITTTAGQNKLNWDAVSGAKYYNIYRSLYAVDGSEISTSMDLGFLGRTISTEFIDTNIVPDFTTSPPLYNNPFAAGAVATVEVDNAGSGYTRGELDVTFTGGGGSGAEAKAIVDASGEVIAVRLLNGGEDYTSAPTASVSGAGSGATFTVTINPEDGIFPRANTRFQQRRYYAGTTEQPMTLFGSRPGLQDSFYDTAIQSAASPIQLDIDAEEVDPIRHLVPLRNGLFILNASSIWRARGSDDAILSPTSGLAEPIAYAGATELQPLRIDQGFLYVQGKGASVKSMQEEQGVVRRDLSIFSNDFFSAEFPIKSWAFAEDPYRLVWAQREDGVMLVMAYVPEQNVYAWTPITTSGDYLAVGVAEEDLQDRVYFAVRRTINGVERVVFERLATRDDSTVETMWSLDAAITNNQPKPGAKLTMLEGEGTGKTVTASASVFSAGDVGKHLRANGGRALVKSYVSGTEVTVDWEIAADVFRNGSTSEYPVVAAGDWTLTEKSSTFSGLDYLEGETVRVFADGNDLGDFEVSGGSITLPHSYSKVLVGLSYVSELETLPLFSNNAVIQDEFKNIQAVSLRLNRSRGVLVGRDKLYPMKERTTEGWNEPNRFLTGYKSISIGAGWTREGTFKVRREAPTFVSLLGVVADVEISDDN